MRRRVLLTLICAIGLTAFAHANISKKEPGRPETGFIENKGQIVDQNGARNNTVRYLLNKPGLNVQLRDNGFSYDAYTITGSLSKITRKTDAVTTTACVYNFHRIDITFIDANTNVEISTEGVNADYLNYAKADMNVTGIHHYNKVTYHNIYPAIDLEFTTNLKDGKLVEYNFIVRPGGNPAQIKMSYAGANSTKLEDNRIKMNTRHGDLREHIPASFLQDSKDLMEVKYKQLDENTYGYAVAAYDRNKTLIIDPTPDLAWGTYYGGSGSDLASDIAVSGNNVYSVGYTASTNNIATSGAYSSSIIGGVDAFIAKLNRHGVRQWATYYGGSGNEITMSASATANGDVVICGQTSSVSGIATSGVLNQSIRGTYDGFITRFNANGGLVWGTYFGGSQLDNVFSVAFDNNGDIAYCGVTGSSDNIASINGIKTSPVGGADAFVGKLAGNATGVYWSTYLGTDNLDEAYSVAVDASNNVFVSGIAYAPTAQQFLTTTGSHQPFHAGDTTDYFLVKFNSGGAIQWGTYFGGNQGEERASNIAGRRIATDASGNVYLVGCTLSPNGIATTSGGSTPGFGVDGGFVAKFSAGGVQQWGKYQFIGNSAGTYCVAADANSNVYTLGFTSSSSGEATTGAYQASAAGSFNMILTKMNTNGLTDWATYYSGGNGVSVPTGIAVDNASSVYVAGYTNTTLNGHQSQWAHQSSNGGGVDAIFAKFIKCNTVTANTTVTPTCFGQSNGNIVVNATGGIAPYIYALGTGTRQQSNTYANLGAGNYTVYAVDTIGCKGQAIATVTQTAQMITAISGPTTSVVFGTNTYNVPSQSGVTYTWTVNNGTIASGNGTNSITVNWGPNTPGEVKVRLSNSAGCTDSSTLAVTLAPTGVQEVAGKGAVVAYPNPTTGLLYIKTDDSKQDISILDRTGRVVFNRTIQGEKAIDISHLPAGIYILKMGDKYQEIGKL